MQDLTESERLERKLLIQRLQAELRTEEMRLVLLKKIRQTQLLAAQQQQQQQVNLTTTPNMHDLKNSKRNNLADGHRLCRHRGQCLEQTNVTHASVSAL